MEQVEILLHLSNLPAYYSISALLCKKVHSKNILKIITIGYLQDFNAMLLLIIKGKGGAKWKNFNITLIT